MVRLTISCCFGLWITIHPGKNVMKKKLLHISEFELAINKYLIVL